MFFVNQIYPPVLLQIAVLISIGFIASWSPYGMVSLWSIFHDSRLIPPEVTLLPCMFAKTSTVYNPLIYYIFSQSFRREVKQLCSCLLPKSTHVSYNVKDSNCIYMVSGHTKPRIDPGHNLQEIPAPRQWFVGGWWLLWSILATISTFLRMRNVTSYYSGIVTGDKIKDKLW